MKLHHPENDHPRRPQGPVKSSRKVQKSPVRVPVEHGACVRKRRPILCDSRGVPLMPAKVLRSLREVLQLREQAKQARRKFVRRSGAKTSK